MATQGNIYECHTCRKIVPADTEAIMADHFREHVKEGVLEETWIPMGDGMAGLVFRHIEDKHWGYVNAVDGKAVAITTFENRSVMVLERWQVEGVIRIGDAVRLEWRRAQPGRKARGTWFAVPLGYKADWLVNST